MQILRPSASFSASPYRARASRLSQRDRVGLLNIQQGFETGEFAQKRELYSARRAIALLCDDQLGEPLIFLIVGLVNLFTVDEHHQIGILFDRAGFTKI